MAALDFPASPTVNQQYPTPAVPGVPVYTWDGEKWTTKGGAVGSTGGADDPPGANGIAAAGSSTQWAREDHIHPELGVRVDVAQSWSAAQQAQARSNIGYVPLVATAYSGIQINGAMEVSQELGTTGSAIAAGTSKIILDGWTASVNGAGRTASAAQIPSLSVPGFSFAFGFSCATPNATLAAADSQIISHGIEGFRAEKLAFGGAVAQPVTISFWVNSSTAGTMAVSIRNAGGTRSYVADVVLTAGVWAYKTVTIPGCTDGTWPTGNGVWGYLTFCFGSGTNSRAASANTWVATNSFATAATTNFFSTTTSIYMTGVTILPGTQGPTAAESANLMRSYGEELVLCKRYWHRVDWHLYSAAPAAGSYWVQNIAVPPMRATPTGAGSTLANTNFGTITASVSGSNGPNGMILFVYGIATSAGYAEASGYYSLDARI